jgi:hypothetical protein
MTIQRACAFVAVAVVALALSGCFVVSKNLPAGMSAAIDPRLVGTWQGFDAESKEPDEAYLHFQEPHDGAPLRLVWVEDRNYQVYDVMTMRVGTRNVFAAKLLAPPEALQDGEIPQGFYLGFYDVAPNGMDLSFSLFDAEKIGELIKKGALKGTAPPKKYDMATLTGSPAELARFLASPDAQAALVDDPARLHRLSPLKN